jgi:acyl-CoA synthetase (AMP-forming)/AMP-acid ligase II
MTSQFLDERLFEHARATPDAPAVGAPTEWISYAELARRVDHLAADLQARGVEPGTFVLNMLPAGIASVAAGLAILRAGGCAVEVHRGWGPAFISKVIEATQARFAFAQPSDAARIARLPAGDRVGIVSADHRSRRRAWARRVERSPDDLALLLFTSATTGEPRGVMLTHRNIAANTASIVEYLGLTAADRILSILPLSYCYGRSLLQTHLWVGGSIVFDHRFMYPRLVMEALAEQRCTGFAGVPQTFAVLRRTCNPRGMHLPHLRYVTQAGGAMGQDLREWVADSFSPARLWVMYGQTEATARLAYLPPERLKDKAGAAGIPIPGVELRIVDDEGREVAEGTVGNLQARGDCITPGYFDAPEDTARILKDGWLWTNDLARRDADGYYFVVGRRRSMLKVSGHRFAPEEVEQRVEQHPAVREVCVVGASHPVTGQAPWAFVALDAAVDEAALRKFCAETLPTFKVPRAIVVVDQLPRSEAGKIRRAELEQRAAHAATLERTWT